MKGDKKASVGCTQAKEGIVKRKAELSPLGLQWVGFGFAVIMKLA